jgi:hypothetical protein
VLEVVGGQEDAEVQVMWPKTMGISPLMPCTFVCPIFLATVKLHHLHSPQR